MRGVIRNEKQPPSAPSALVAAATTTDDECRAKIQPATVQVLQKKQQLELAKRAAATNAHSDREKSRKAKAALDRTALKRLRASTPPPLPTRRRLLASRHVLSSTHPGLATSHSWVWLSACWPNIIKTPFVLRTDAKSVSSARCSRLSHTENFPTTTLRMLFANPSTPLETVVDNAGLRTTIRPSEGT